VRAKGYYLLFGACPVLEHEDRVSAQTPSEMISGGYRLMYSVGSVVEFRGLGCGGSRPREP
jgi:hypothetical protein